jgi:hypothetical protein
MTNKQKTERAANALLKKMKGEGWQKRIYEHVPRAYSVYNGGLSIERLRTGRYFALLADTPYFGCACWTNRRRKPKEDPNEAAQSAIKDARRRLNECIKIVEAAEALYKPKKKAGGKA